MASFILRKVDDAFWARFRNRAQKEGHPMRWVILKLIEHYTKHGLPKGPDHV